MSETTTQSPDNANPGEVNPAPERRVTLSDNAVKRILELAQSPDHAGKNLRITVSGGGCQGFSYGFSCDDEVKDEDSVFEYGGAKLVIDEMSLDMLAGSEVDFAQDLMGAYFKITNPNASSTCGCGTSFSV